MNNANLANRLADEKSPYSLQHANNPVCPWSEEAICKAREEDSDIVLLID